MFDLILDSVEDFHTVEERRLHRIFGGLSFFATLKKEKIYQIAAYKLPREQVKTIIFRYVFAYYNRIRIYTSNPQGLPPVRYREWAANHRQSAA